jgi:hypothetical protein
MIAIRRDDRKAPQAGFKMDESDWKQRDFPREVAQRRVATGKSNPKGAGVALASKCESG